MAAQPIKHIALVGEGVELWFAAAFLAGSLKPFNVIVTCVELEPSAQASPLTTLSPSLLRLLKPMQVGELELIRQCLAGYSLGLDCSNTHNRFFVPYGELGLAPQDSALVGAAYTQGGVNNLDALNLAATAARQGKFAVVGADRSDLQALLRYSVNVEARLLVNYLKNHAQQLGVKYVPAATAIKDIVLNNGQITSLQCANGEAIYADFWLDLSAQGVLQEVTKNTEMLSFAASSHDVFVAQSCQDSPPSHAAQTIRVCGNVLQDAVCSAAFKQDTFYGDNQNELMDTCKKAPFKNHHWQHSKKSYCALAAVWKENCLRLGAPALQMPGPVFSRLSLTIAALVQFVDLLPNTDVNPALIQAYNRGMSAYLNEAFSYNAVVFSLVNKKYAATDRQLSPCDVFARTGRLLPAATDAVAPQQWQCLLYGLMGAPVLQDVSLDRIAPNDITVALNKLDKKIIGMASGMPGYAEFLERLLGHHS